ncbi:hypothetical protein ACFL1X_03875 [Candidatus Hydrogenedentota bacterium]
MRKISEKLLAFICTLIVLMAGILFMVLAVGERGPLTHVIFGLNTFLFGDPGINITLGLVGALGTALSLLTLSVLFRSGGSSRFVTFNGELGDIHVSSSTIEKLIAHGAGYISEVERISATVRTSPDGQRVRIGAQVTIMGGQDVKKTCEKVQQFIKDSVSDAVGLTEFQDITVTVKEILPADTPDSSPYSGGEQPPGVM